MKEWRKKNPEKFKRQKERSYKRRLEKMDADPEYREKILTQVKEYSRKRYENNREEILKLQKEYYQKQRWKCMVYDELIRTGCITEEFINKLMEGRE